MSADPLPPARTSRAADRRFLLGLALLGGSYVAIVAAMLLADLCYTTPAHLAAALASPEIRYAARLSLVSATITTLLALWVAVPLGYLLARSRFRGHAIVDALVDIPLVLPPLVIGLSLLILFQLPVGGVTLEGLCRRWLGRPVTYAVPAVILAQFTVVTALAVRAMRVTFEQVNPRAEQVALTLGCNRSQAFWRVTLPEARRGMITAATLVWARALGEFGPVLVFAGATRMRTEVLPTTVFLELSVGNVEAAVAISLLMVAGSLGVLLLVRAFGSRVLLG